METKPMVSVSKHSIIIAAQVFEMMLAYTKYFIHDRQTRLNAYLEELERTQGSLPDSNSEEGRAIDAARNDIRRAQALAQDIERIKIELSTIYKWNFVKLADVWRDTLKHLGIDHVEDMYSLKVYMFYLMEMLKSENPSFSKEKFLEHIHAER